MSSLLRMNKTMDIINVCLSQACVSSLLKFRRYFLVSSLRIHFITSPPKEPRVEANLSCSLRFCPRASQSQLNLRLCDIHAFMAVINGGVDPGGPGGPAWVASLQKESLIVCPTVSSTCRPTQLAPQMHHLRSSTLTFVRGHTLLESGRMIVTCLSQIARRCVIKRQWDFCSSDAIASAPQKH